MGNQMIDAAALGGPKVAAVATLVSVCPVTPFLFTTYELPPEVEPLAAALRAGPASSRHLIWQVSVVVFAFPIAGVERGGMCVVCVVCVSGRWERGEWVGRRGRRGRQWEKREGEVRATAHLMIPHNPRLSPCSAVPCQRRLLLICHPWTPPLPLRATPTSLLLT